MQRKSYLPFQKIEDRLTLFLHRSLFASAFLRVIGSLIAHYIVADINSAKAALWSGDYWRICSIIYLITAVRLAPRFSSKTRYLLFVEIFIVQIAGYHQNALLFLEYIFIPMALWDIAVLFSARVSIPLEIIYGVFFAPLMSVAIQKNATVQIAAFSFPLLLVTWPFFLSCAFSNSLVAMLIQEQKLLSVAHNTEISINRNLDSINRALSAQMYAVKAEAELYAKKQVTKDIHDNIGHIFVNLIMMLQATSAIFEQDVPRAKSMLNNCVDYSCNSMNEIRQLLRTIRSTERPMISIRTEMSSLIKLFSRCTGTSVYVEYGNWPKRFEPALSSFLLSFVKETLTNSIKHGMATKIYISCWQGKRELSMTVQDNGCSDLCDIHYGIGLQNIQESLEQFHGKLSANHLDNGFMVRIKMPYPINGE